jgi:hypothetical protein
MGNENLKAKRESPVLTDVCFSFYTFEKIDLKKKNFILKEEVETLKANTCYSGDEIKDFHAKFLVRLFFFDTNFYFKTIKYTNLNSI